MDTWFYVEPEEKNVIVSRHEIPEKILLGRVQTHPPGASAMRFVVASLLMQRGYDNPTGYTITEV